MSQHTYADEQAGAQQEGPVTEPTGDVIRTYLYGAAGAKAAQEHADAIGGTVTQNDEDGLYSVHGTWAAECERLLRATSDEALLREYARATHAIHAARDLLREHRGTAREADRQQALTDLRASRDRLQAECLRRMGGDR